MEVPSLIERLKMRNAAHDDAAASDSSEDVDDNITLDKSLRRMNEKQQAAFTRVQGKQTKSLKEVIQRKQEERSQTSAAEPLHVTQSDDDDDLPQILTPQTLNTNTEIQSPPFELPATSTSPHKRSEGNVFVRGGEEPRPAAVAVKRRKLNPEEKKLEKERKEREKIEKAKERQRLKFEKEMEKERQKAIRKVTSLNNRNERKDEAMERILVVVAENVAQEESDVLQALRIVGACYEIKPQMTSPCIGWLRENLHYDVQNATEIKKTCVYEEEKQLLYRMPATQLAQLSSKQPIGKELKNFVKELKITFKNKSICIVVIGIQAYYRLSKTKRDQQLRSEALGGMAPVKNARHNLIPVSLVDRKQIEQTLLRIQITESVSFRFTENSLDFAELVASFTKSVADAPFKADSSSLQFSYVPDKASVKVCSDGHGVLQLWNQQLQQFLGVRNDTSVAITQNYPSPLALVKAYRVLSEEEGSRLLENIEIRRGVGVLQTNRRVGPELSKKIHRLLTAIDGNLPLAK